MGARGKNWQHKGCAYQLPWDMRWYVMFRREPDPTAIAERLAELYAED